MYNIHWIYTAQLFSSGFCQPQHQCHASHTESLLQYQCISYYVIMQYNNINLTILRTVVLWTPFLNLFYFFHKARSEKIVLSSGLPHYLIQYYKQQSTIRSSAVQCGVRKISKQFSKVFKTAAGASSKVLGCRYNFSPDIFGSN